MREGLTQGMGRVTGQAWTLDTVGVMGMAVSEQGDCGSWSLYLHTQVTLPLERASLQPRRFTMSYWGGG